MSFVLMRRPWVGSWRGFGREKNPAVVRSLEFSSPLLILLREKLEIEADHAYGMKPL